MVYRELLELIVNRPRPENRSSVSRGLVFIINGERLRATGCTGGSRARIHINSNSAISGIQDSSRPILATLANSNYYHLTAHTPLPSPLPPSHTLPHLLIFARQFIIAIINGYTNPTIIITGGGPSGSKFEPACVNYRVSCG